jgi:hypothetical protein
MAPRPLAENTDGTALLAHRGRATAPRAVRSPWRPRRALHCNKWVVPALKYLCRRRLDPAEPMH